jgi:replicative DNA helicase
MTAELLSYTAAKSEGEGDLDTWVAEQALLAGCLAHKDVWSIAAEHVKPADFSDTLNGRIFEAMGQLQGDGKQINPVALFMSMRGGSDDAALRRYIADLAMSNCGTIPAMIVDWAVCIRTFARKRKIRAATEQLSTGQFNRSLNEIAADLSGLALAVQESGPTFGARSLGDAALSALDQVDKAHKAGGKIIGVPTGLIDLDSILGGLAPSDLTILGGRPSMGKTALGLNIAFNAAKAGHKVAFFSMEMSGEQLALRILASMTGIGSDQMRRGDLDEQEFCRLVEARSTLDRLPLEIEDSAAMTVQAIRLAAEKVKRRRGLDLIVVDYLQLARPDRERESRTVDITEVSAGLKAIAKALSVPVLALAQLSRAVEQREDKRPQLADLRDSGAIEQDADQVLFLYRDEYYASRSEPDPKDPRYSAWQERMARSQGIADIIVAKNRHGRIGDARVSFDGRRQLFQNLYQAGQHG